MTNFFKSKLLKPKFKMRELIINALGSEGNGALKTTQTPLFFLRALFLNNSYGTAGLVLERAQFL